MGYKKMNQSLGFADLALASSLKHNRSLKTMEKLDKAINWSRVKEILMNHYTVRPLKNVQFCSRPRKAKILTTGIH